MADNIYIKDGKGATQLVRSTDNAGVQTPHSQLEAGETHIGELAVAMDVVDVTLTLDTSAYADGDVLSDTATITSAVRVTGGRSFLHSLTVIDEDDQGVAFDLLFFKVTQSLGTKNSPPSISDANARDCLGFVKVLTTDYIDLGGVRVASTRGLDLMLEANSGSTSVFLATITRGGTPTYTVNGLKLKLGIEQKN